MTIRVSDREASRRFYELGLSTVGFELTHEGEHYDEWNDFGISQATDAKPLTRRAHIGFVAESRDPVNAFWRALTDAGYRDDGPPGERPEYAAGYYGGFVLDPDGNSVEAVYHGRPSRADGCIVDHIWMRVRDLDASRRFYETIAPFAGIELHHVGEREVGFRGYGPTYLFVVASDEPTANAHLAFPAPDDAGVDEFHRVALAAGYRDNGPPGERPEYHAGYHGAYVLDPDGNNVEAVCHNRRG